MKTKTCAKINIGLNVVSRREDGYHNLETIFYPVPLYDTLDLVKSDDGTSGRCELSASGIEVCGEVSDNLVVRAYGLLHERYTLPSVRVQLHKDIPSQAGLGGGSSDAAAMLKLLNRCCDLGISDDELCLLARELGADCPFFIHSTPVYATGIGDEFEPVPEMSSRLSGMYLVMVKPPVSVSTGQAYSLVKPHAATYCCREIAGESIERWKELLVNDFEYSVFSQFPVLAEVKASLYAHGADYVQMSGSGSTIFALYKKEPVGLPKYDADTFTYITKL